MYGKGEDIREWLYVSDCAEAIFKILKKGIPSGIYNVGSGYEKPNIEIAKMIFSLLEKSEDLIEFVEDRPGHDFRYLLDFSKIKNILDGKLK